MLNTRLLIDDDDKARVEELLDEEYLDSDWDDGDRLMVSSDDLDNVLTLFETNEISFEVL